MGRPPQLAAGCLVWRVRGGELQVLLVHRPRYKDWSWPKGKLEPGEALVQCALRETIEETGLQVVLGQPLPGLSYLLRTGRAKRVSYWSARVASPKDAPAIAARASFPRASKAEIDKTAWVSATKAVRRISRAADTKPLRALIAAHEAGALDTHPVIVVRHARAKSRSSWKGDEATRPLTPSGRARAAALVDLFAAFGVTSLWSSPWARCASTLRPYARAADLPVKESDWLTEAGHLAGPERAREILERALRSSRARALSTHRPVLPALMAELAAHTGPGQRRRLPTEDPYLHTGEALVAHVARGRVIAIEQHRPVPRLDASEASSRQR